MQTLSQHFKQIALFLLLFVTLGAVNLSAQCTGQKFRTIRHGATLLPGSTATSLIYGGSQPAMGCVTTTKTDIAGLASAQFNYASGSYLNNLGSGAPAGLIEAANDGGGTRITLWNGTETDLVYNFAAPVTNPILFVGGAGTAYGSIGLYTGASIEVVGKTVTKLGGDPSFNAAGSMITNNGASTITAQHGYVQINGTMSTFTLKLKSTAAVATYQWFDLHVGACYSAPPAATPCPGKELWTATHSAITPAKSHAQMKNGNSIVIDRVDVVGTSIMAGSALGGDTYTNGVLQCFPNGGDYVKGGGYINLTTAVGGTTELTYTFCNPVTDPFVFFGWAGISAGGEVAFDKPIDIMDAEDGFAKVAAQSVGVCGSDLYQNGYVKVKGTFTSFKMTFKSGPTWNQVFTMMVGECTDVTPKATVTQPACIATAVQKYVDFTQTAADAKNPGFLNAYKTVGTSIDFLLKDNLGAPITNEKGGGVKANITTSAAAGTVCGPFSTNALSFLLGLDNVQGVVAAGDSYSYKYKFNAPVKVQLSSEVGGSYGLAYSEFVIIEAKKGGAPVNVSATISVSTLGLVTAVPGNPNAVMIQGGWGGNLWKAWPAGEVDEITFTYKSNNNDAYVQEPHRIAICSAPCAPQAVAGCTPANERTEAFGFTRTSATTATGAKGSNTLTMTTTAGIPILAAAGSGASTMNECGDANKQLAVSSGGWALLGAKANQTGGKITINFAQPVTNPMILVWNIYYSTKLDINGVSTCLQPIRTWYGATAGPGITNPGDNSSITGTFYGAGGIGYYQVPGTFTKLEFDVETGIWENWFYLSVGEGVCGPTAPEVINTSLPRALTCTSPTGNLRTYDANFDTNLEAWKKVSGKLYNPVAIAGATAGTTRPVGYPVGLATAVNDVTVDCSVNNSYYLGLYGYTSYPAGQVPASSGCTPSTADFASAGGGAVYAYASVGTQGTFPWVTPGNMKWSLKNEVVNPIIKVKYLSWTKLTFKDCDGNVIPIATIPGTFKYGLTASGSSISDSNDWGDGLEGEGAVQLIGRFKEINISVEKTAIWLDYFSLTMSEQVCTDNTPVVVACDAVIPSCPVASAGPTPPASSGNPSTVAAGFTKSGVVGAIGSLSVGGKPVVIGLVSTSEVLSANTDRATSTFNNAACYSVAPAGGGAVTIKDIGGNGTTTITLSRAIANPLIYVKDLTRLQLDFSSTLDIAGNPVCCMKQISGSNGLSTTGTLVSDNNPTEVGSPSAPLTPGCGLIQLVGTFNTIVIKTSRPSGTALFENWTISIGGEAVCVPDAVLASLGTVPPDPANPGIAPTVIPAPTSATNPPVPVGVTKAIANIKPATTPGNQIVTYRVNIRNNSATTKINNLFFTDMFDPKYVPGVVVAVIPPVITFPGGPLQQTNASFNGTSNTDLLNMSVNNMLGAFESLTIEYGVEINPTLIPGGMRHNNNLVVGSTTMALKVSNLNSADPNAPIQVPFYPPASIQMPMDKEVTICNGAAPVEFAKYGQCQGGAKIMNNPACGAINWSFDWVADKSKTYCGGTSGKIVTFRGIDACQNVYEYTTKFTTTDNCAPIFDMQPMDKTVACTDANVLASINMWLASTGGAWFGDTGSEKTTVTSAHDYKQTTCVPGVYKVTFTVTDGCSNSSTATATLTVKATSTTTPTPSVISNNNELISKTIQCTAPMAFDQPNVTTNCPAGIKSLTHTDAKVNGTCANTYKMRRTWLATDECGTTFTIAQEIAVVDNTAPVFNTKASSFTMTSAHFAIWKKVYFSKFLKANDGCSKTNMQAPTFTYSADKTKIDCKIIATDECANISQYACVVNINNSKVITKVISDDNNLEMEITIDELEQIAAIDETVESKEAILYPNPTNDILRIIPAVGHGTLNNVKITSVDGRVMLSQKITGQTDDIITIDVKGFNTGNYIIEMEHSNKKLYKLIQKIN